MSVPLGTTLIVRVSCETLPPAPAPVSTYVVVFASWPVEICVLFATEVFEKFGSELLFDLGKRTRRVLKRKED